jgi:transcriptional regulator GlxA family with amidase domain
VSGKRPQRYQQIVDRFEEIASANLGKSSDISALREIAGVSQRTLARAFHKIRGVTPSRYLQMLRLSQVRQVLLSKDHLTTETVTQVAMRFGFRELGRFAVDYRAVFGESPSETLRRSVASIDATGKRRDECAR